MVRTASDSCFGGVCWGRAPPGVVRCPLEVGLCWSLCRGMPFLRVGPGAPRCVFFSCASVSVLFASWPMAGVLLPCCVAPSALCLWAPARHFGPFLAPLPEFPFLYLALPLPAPFPYPLWRWWGGGGVCGALMAQAWGWVAWSHRRRVLGAVGGAEALDRVVEEGLPCRLRHGGVRGGLVGVCAAASADLLEGVHHVHPFAPSRAPAQLHPAAELLQGGGRPPDEVGGGAWGGEGSELGVLEWREEDVDIWRWRAWRRPRERERRWLELGMEDGYGRRGERVALWGWWGEGEVDRGRQGRAWRRTGER